MDRYFYTEITGSNGRKVQAYESTWYPTINPTQNDIYIHSRKGDRLDNLAHQYYGNTGLWWVLALVNNLGKGSFDVPPAIQIRIPSRASIAQLLPMLKQSMKDE